MASKAIGKMLLDNYRLTTAEILYFMPDHPMILQSYVWQELDLAPDFPVLKKFLGFWEKELDGRLYSVRVDNCKLIKASEFYHYGNNRILD
jgi:uncharacterized protein Usg